MDELFEQKVGITMKLQHIKKYLKNEESNLLDFDLKSLTSEEENEDGFGVEDDIEIIQSVDLTKTKKKIEELLFVFRDGSNEKRRLLKNEFLKKIQYLINGFRAALNRIEYVTSIALQTDNNVVSKYSTKYLCDSSEVLDEIIQLTIQYLSYLLIAFINGESLNDYLKVKNVNNWKPISSLIFNKHLTDVLIFMKKTTNADTLHIFIRYVYNIIDLFVIPYQQHCGKGRNRRFMKLTEKLIKFLIDIWSEQRTLIHRSENLRVIAYLAIYSLFYRLTKEGRCYAPAKNLCEISLKRMYVCYVKSSTQINKESLISINFMRITLAQLYEMNSNIFYVHAFLFIRQMALQLRRTIRGSDTAIESATSNSKKKRLETMNLYDNVYNGCFIKSLQFWHTTLSTILQNIKINHSNNDELMKRLSSLTYPLIQLSFGTIRLTPIEKYYPIRFQIIRYSLIEFNKKQSDIFIPILPLIMEILDQTDFNKYEKSSESNKDKLANTKWENLNEHQKIDFDVVLKLNKQQLSSFALRQILIEEICDVLINYLDIYSNDISFPELAAPILTRLRRFIKLVKVANFRKLFKEIIDKLEANSNFIEVRRRDSQIYLADNHAVLKWKRETEETTNSPLRQFANDFRKKREDALLHKRSNKEKISMNRLTHLMNISSFQKQLKKSPIDKLSEENRQQRDQLKKELSSLFVTSDAESSDSSDEFEDNGKTEVETDTKMEEVIEHTRPTEKKRIKNISEKEDVVTLFDMKNFID
ncbi:hypothetical protein SNEBB_000610 [Seison nebaliae]|nr:hypothetical protein SNEBB_000610 [Seison nebaliae]